MSKYNALPNERIMEIYDFTDTELGKSAQSLLQEIADNSECRSFLFCLSKFDGENQIFIEDCSTQVLLDSIGNGNYSSYNFNGVIIIKNKNKELRKNKTIFLLLDRGLMYPIDTILFQNIFVQTNKTVIFKKQLNPNVYLAQTCFINGVKAKIGNDKIEPYFMILDSKNMLHKEGGNPTYEQMIIIKSE